MYDAESVWALTFLFSVLPSVCPNPRPVRRARTKTRTKTRAFYFIHQPHPLIFALGSVMRPMSSGPHQLTPEGSRPPVATSPRISSPIEKHFVLPSILYAGCQHILLYIASYYRAQELTRRAKKWLAKYGKKGCYSKLEAHWLFKRQAQRKCLDF